MKTPGKQGVKKMELPYIASLKHKSEIDASCKDIIKACGVEFFIVYILFKNKQIFVLSNTYSHLSDYYQEGMYKHDSSTSRALFENKGYYLCDNDKGISETYSNLLRNKYSVHRVFYKIYSTPDFDIVLGAANRTPIADKMRFYTKVGHDFENCAINFIEKNKNIFKHYNLELKHSPYFNNPILLKNIFQNIEITPSLTTRERECLALTAKGYTTNEIARMLGISKHTVEEYKGLIMKKLNAVNMPNAIYLAMKQGLLENTLNLVLPNVESIQGFRNLNVIAS